MNRYHFDNSFDEKGKEKHQHLLDGVALTGCSTIVGVLPKVLTYWATGLALEPFGFVKKKNEDGTWALKDLRLATAAAFRRDVAKLGDEEYLNLLDDCYKAHATAKDKAAGKGTDRHQMVEDYVRQVMAGEHNIPFDESILPFVQWSKENVKTFLLSEAHCYSEELWIGGICDLACLMNDGSVAILDVKSNKKVYSNYYAQIAGYNICLSENGAFTKDGDKISDFQYKVKSHIVFPFGAENPTAVARYDVEEAQEWFKSIVGVYRGLSNYKEAK